jgi:hypothetical protein
MTIQLIKVMLFLSWLFVPAFSCLCASDGPENSSLDPRAQQVADKLMQALGGK